VLLAESLLVTTLLLHLVDQQLIGVDLRGDMSSVAILVGVDCFEIFHELVAVLGVLCSLIVSLLLNLVEQFTLLELGLVLAAGAAGLQLRLKLRILLVVVLLELLFDAALSSLVLLEHSLEVGITLGKS